MASIGLIGEYDSSVPAHRAIPEALRLAARDRAVGVEFEWVPTDEIVGERRISPVATEAIALVAQTRLRSAYGCAQIVEGYRCRYGLNPALLSDLTSGRLQIAARSHSGEVRALELVDHPFFVATLFQPERAALKAVTPPLVRAFVESVSQSKSS